jgi:hypothetical protein
VVFDGAGRGGPSSDRTRRGVREVFSPAGQKADPWIVDEVRRLNGECLVVTDDRALAMHCARFDAVVLGCEAFARRVEAAEAPADDGSPDREREPQPAEEPRPRVPDDDLLARMMEVPAGMAARKALDDPAPPPPPDAASRRERRRRNLLGDL